MPDESLNDFLKRKQAESQQQKVDWDERRRTWLEDLAALYARIEGWLEPSIDEGVVKVAREPATLKEEYIGQYQAESLVLTVAGARIRFRPVGTLLVGAKGRVDMLCGAHAVMIVEGDKGWAFAKRREQQAPEFLEFNEQTFADTMRTMLGG